MSGKRERKRRLLRSKSYFNKYFVSFLIMLLVPMLTVLLVFTHAQGVVKEQIQIASKNTLDQFFGRLDDRIEEAYGSCLSISKNSTCNQYPAFVELKDGKTTYQMWQIVNLLKGYTRENYRDIFVYYPIDDQIISGVNGCLTRDAYYNVYYRDQEYDFWQEFLDVVTCSSGKPVLCSMKGKGTDAYLCVAMNQRGTGGAEDGFTVVVVLAKDYVMEVLESVENKGQSGISMIYSGEEVILSTDEIGVSYNLDKEWQPGQVFDDMIEEDKYMMQVQESEVLDAYYVHAVPYAYFWEKLFRMYIVGGLGVLASLAIGICVAWLESKRTYRPVEQIVGNLERQRDIAYNANMNTEFEFMETLFGNDVKEKAEMRQVIRRGAAVKRDNFVYSLLHGKSMVETGDLFGSNGITLCSDRFCVIVFEVESDGILEKHMQLFVLANVYEELAMNVGSGYVILLSANRYGILVNLKNELDRNAVFSAIEEGNEFFQHYYKITASFGISSVQEGILGIHLAYEEACFALKYRYLLGKESIIDYCSVSGREFEYLPVAEAKMLYRVSDYLFGNLQNESASMLLDEVMVDYGIDETSSIESAECFKFEAISVLNRVMTQGGYWSGEWKNAVMELLNQTTLEEFKDLFAGLLGELYKKQQEKTNEKDVCAQVLEYIEANYKEEQLSVNLLGEVFGIAPSYLSKLYKEKYQISIPSVISQTRINSAKELLRSTDWSVKEIAEDSGFLSSSVFVKTFKKLEGITPGMYRSFFDIGEQSVDK